MATQWISPTWRMPENSNQSKLDNYSLEFSGSGEYVSTSDIVVDYTIGWSISFWFNFNTTGQDSLMGRWDSNWRGAYMRASLDEISWYDGANKKFSIPTVSSGDWHHVVFTNDNGSLRCYYDGTESTTGALTSSYDLTINRIGGGSGGWGGIADFDGKMAQCCVFETALISTQITALYNSGTPVNPMALTPLPIAYYPLGGSSTGSASTLTIPNDAVPSATVFNFRGSPIDYITMGNTLTKDGSTAFSISCWIKYTGSGTEMIVSKQDASGYGYLLHTGNHAGVKLTWYPCISAGGNIAVRTSNAYNDGNWHNVLATYDGSGSASGAKIYVDGTLDTNIITDTFTGTSSSTGPFQISARNGTSFPFVGDVSNVVVWSSDQNANKDNIYNNGVPQSTYTTTPEAWYKLNVDTSTWDGTNWTIGEAQANYSSALNFDGTNDYIDCGASSFSGETGISVSAWIYPTANGTGAAEAIISTDIASATRGFYLALYNGFNFRWQISTNGSTKVSCDSLNGSLPGLNQWIHLVGTWDATNMKIYINGTLNKTISSGVASGTFSNTNNILIGARETTAGYFPGKISNAAIFETTLDLTAVQALYNNGTPETSMSSSPVSWWKLNNLTTGIQDSVGSNNGTNNGATVTDIQVSTLNGTSSGMTTANLVTSDLTRSIPYSSYSMLFDGVADDIDLGSSYTTPDKFTISVWANSTSPFPSGTNYGYYVGADVTTHRGIGFAVQEGTVGSMGQGIIYVYFAPGGEALTTTAVTPGVWEHIVFVCDKTVGSYGEIKLYRNGILDTTTTLASADLNNLTEIEHIGSNGYNPHPYIGNLSNVAIWSSHLTEDQILTIYNGGVPNNISSLSPVGWWSLAGDSYFDGTNWICPDLGSGGNNGTSTGMGGTELVGDGPGSTANGVATSMDIPTNLKGDAPNSTSNAFSVNMTAIDRVTSVPG